MKEIKLPKMMKKCKECPYKLGTVKCVENPCLQCIESGSSTNPFGKYVEKYDNKG